MHNNINSQCHIAIVDDERAVRNGLSNLLKSAGYRTRTFPSGEEFLGHDGHSTIDILILDIKLGGMDGFEVQEQLNSTGVHIPVIFVSAHANEAMRKRAFERGAIAFRSKPIDVEALLSDIHTTLVSSGRTR